MTAVIVLGACLAASLGACWRLWTWTKQLATDNIKRTIEFAEQLTEERMRSRAREDELLDRAQSRTMSEYRSWHPPDEEPAPPQENGRAVMDPDGYMEAFVPERDDG